MRPNLSQMGSIISDPSRAAILSTLIDGNIHPASELALIAKIKPQTASHHLNKMKELNIISVEKHGRHRYYKLKNKEVANVIENLYSIAPETPVKSLKDSTEKKAIHYARTCYDHLAGYVGVQVTNALQKKRFITKEHNNFALTEQGKLFFKSLGIDIDEVQKKRRAFSRCCLDWSERKHHLAGALGNELLNIMFNENWIQRHPNSRAIEITSHGKKKMQEVFEIEL